MVYIACALYVEAEKIIKKYNLKRDSLVGGGNVYAGEEMRLIITDTRAVNAAINLTRYLAHEKIDKNDYFINFGSAAATKDLANQLLLAVKITDDCSGETYYVDLIEDFYNDLQKINLVTVAKPLKADQVGADVYDMEATGLYQAAKRYFTADRMIFAKYVSDSGIDSGRIDITPADKIMDELDHVLKTIMDSQTNEEEDVHIYADKLSELLSASATSEAMILNLLKFNKSLGYAAKDLYDDFIEAYDLKEKVNRKQGKQLFNALSDMVKNRFKL